MNLEEIEKARKRGYYGEYGIEIDWLLSEVKRLREGIEKFKNRHKNRQTNYYDETLLNYNDFEIECEKHLYKLLED